MQALQQRLEEETERARRLQGEFTAKVHEVGDIISISRSLQYYYFLHIRYFTCHQQLKDRENQMENMRVELAKEIERVRDGATEDFLVDLRKREVRIRKTSDPFGPRIGWDFNTMLEKFVYISSYVRSPLPLNHHLA